MAQATYNLSGKSIFITGAARGIGAESARRLAARGANVTLVDLDAEALERAAASCGAGAAWFEGDVTDRESLDAAIAGALDRFGGIDVAMANAGIAPVGLVRDIDPTAFERTIEINLLGVWRTIRACLPHVLARRGYLLPVASMAAALHSPGMSAYAAAKSGVEAFADSLRLEVAHHGVDVGVAYFSWIATDMVAGADAHPVGGFMRGNLRGPFAKTYPVSAAADDVVRGIERRSRLVVTPGWARALLVARGLFQPLMERSVRDQIPEAERIWIAETERRGIEAASAPVGAGGAAESRARSGEVTPTA
jgi:NAD(P)-dependent dehydrogenase (short-subunit alcohol dehydrogenase family)